MYLRYAAEALALHASTSPSYLVLQSLDLCNAYLAEGYPKALAETVARLSGVRAVLGAHGYVLQDREPLKLVIEAPKSGYTGEDLAAILRENGIEPEFADGDYLVLMCTPENTEEELVRLCCALCSVSLRAPLVHTLPSTHHPVAALSVREAMLAPAERVSLADAKGRICAAPTVSCPPAVPIAVAGEVIDEASVACLAYYGVKDVAVVKE